MSKQSVILKSVAANVVTDFNDLTGFTVYFPRGGRVIMTVQNINLPDESVYTLSADNGNVLARVSIRPTAQAAIFVGKQ